MSEQITFTVPLNYRVPCSLKRLSPEVLCHVFDCMDFIISKFNMNFEENHSQSKHQEELNTVIAQYMKKMEDQKIQLLDERTEAINSVKKREYDECKQEIQKLQTDYASEKKKLQEECDEQL